MATWIRKLIDAIRDWFVMFFWPRVALSNIQADTQTMRAATGMILRNTKMIIQGQEKLMGAVDDLKAAFNEATNAIAARIDRILQGQDEALRAALQPELDRLLAMGSDPVEPVPPVPPVDDPNEPAVPTL